MKGQDLSQVLVNAAIDAGIEILSQLRDSAPSKPKKKTPYRGSRKPKRKRR